LLHGNQTRVLLVLCILGILYLSLYPFAFTPTAKESIAWHGPHIDSDWVDMVANFLFYLPLGFLATAVQRRQNPASVLAAALLGAVLSLGIELAQMYLPQRDSNFRDLACNTAGTLAGSFSAFAVRRSWPNVAIPRLSPMACGLILLWIGWQMFPFVPVLRRYKLHEIAAQLRLWNFHRMEFGDIAFAALTLYAFIARRGRKTGIAALMAAVVLALALVGQSLVRGLIFSNTGIAAAATGLILGICLWRPEQRAPWFALGLILSTWLVLDAFDPVKGLDSTSPGFYVRHFAGRAFFCCAILASLYRALPLALRWRRTTRAAALPLDPHATLDAPAPRKQRQ
jgi:VanZ family protein